MNAFRMVDGHRVFPADCPLPAGEHVVGDRHANDHHLPDELTAAGTWTAVCPEDDKPMLDRDPEGWLACEWCGVRAVDAQ